MSVRQNNLTVLRKFLDIVDWDDSFVERHKKIIEFWNDFAPGVEKRITVHPELTISPKQQTVIGQIEVALEEAGHL